MADISPPPITILIADDEEFARAGIRTLLSRADDLEVIGEAQDGFEVKELVPQLRPNILCSITACRDPEPTKSKNGCVKITRKRLLWC